MVSIASIESFFFSENIFSGSLIYKIVLTNIFLTLWFLGLHSFEWLFQKEMVYCFKNKKVQADVLCCHLEGVCGFIGF